jgi:hypothetical protein
MADGKKLGTSDFTLRTSVAGTDRIPITGVGEETQEVEVHRLPFAPPLPDAEVLYDDVVSSIPNGFGVNESIIPYMFGSSALCFFFFFFEVELYSGDSGAFQNPIIFSTTKNMSHQVLPIGFKNMDTGATDIGKLEFKDRQMIITAPSSMVGNDNVVARVASWLFTS